MEVKIKKGKTDEETVRLALEDGEGRAVADREVTRALNFLGHREDETREVFQKMILTGAYVIRWNSEQQALDYDTR